MLVIKKNLKGLTLVEMLVSIGIMSIVMAGMSALFIMVWKSQAYQIKLGQASMFASRGVSAVVKNIRQAQQADDGSYLLQSGDNFDVVFFANIDGDGMVERVHYYLSGDTFFMGITEPAAAPPYAYPAGDESTTIVSNNVVNSGTEYIFQYYDRNADLLAVPVSPASVRMIEVRLLVDVNPFTSPIPVTVKSRTTLRNLVNY